MVFAKKFKSQQTAKVATLVDSVTRPVQTTIDLDNLIYLKSIPDDYIISNYYIKFSYVLPSDFVNSGEPKLTKLEGWYDEINMDGVRLTFSNGIEEF